MNIAVGVLIGCQFFVLLCLGLMVRYWYHRIRSEAEETVRNFVSCPDEKTPSPLAMLADQVALLLAARLMQQIKAMLAGVESGESKAAASFALEGVASQSPWVALIAGMLPQRIRNGLMRNPQMMGALSKLGGLGGNHQAASAEAQPRKHKD
jgi:hypothetical protein